jgi:hypothetical protein
VRVYTGGTWTGWRAKTAPEMAVALFEEITQKLEK